MESGLKKITASVLIIATLFFATLAVLSIWDIIQVEKNLSEEFFHTDCDLLCFRYYAFYIH